MRKENIAEYTAVFQKAPGGSYTVIVPALPGCISEGDTFEKAAENVQEAIGLYLEVVAKSRLAKQCFTQKEEIFSAPVKVRV